MGFACPAILGLNWGLDIDDMHNFRLKFAVFHKRLLGVSHLPYLPRILTRKKTL
jgi:hypothetical protein